MESGVRLAIITPEGVLLDEVVDYVSVPGTLGDFGVYFGHATLLSSMRVGCLHYKVENEGVNVFVSGGFVDVSKEAVNVLADVANPASFIDVERAIRAKERAETRLREMPEGVDVERAQAALERALKRLQIAALA